MDEDVAAATRLIESLAPGDGTVQFRTPLAVDECRWFVLAVETGVVSFRECPTECFRFKKWGASGPDHFDTPDGKPRHLFSKPGAPEAWLNREYVPHLAAYAYAILDRGYDGITSSFSRYRTFSRDLIAKRSGQSYETDAEFYDRDGRVHLQIEAKASPSQTAALAAAIERHGTLSGLPSAAAKEIEYVLDLAPRSLWVVGPGSIDPPTFVYRVEMNGPLDASFTRIADLPAPPGDP
ncbi:MAG: hypothetical protein H6513_03480 [Acidimicrobiaceae bacterium]|nr:hypothetical protein [Acidimicrobiaceae bacterium]